MKRIILALLLIFVAITPGIGRCMIADQKPTVIVMNGKENIANTTSGISDIQTIPSKDLFKFAFRQSAKSIKYLKPGQKVTLSFANHPPDTIAMKNSVLNSNGEIRYNERVTMDVPLSKNNKEYYFIVQTHMASALSSYYEKNQKDFIGYAATMTWGKIAYVAVFVIKTDAL